MSMQGTATAGGNSQQTLDTTAYGSHLVTVIVDKVPVTVTLKQALEGFMLQSNYSSKSNDLAAERDRLRGFEDKHNQMQTWFTNMERDPEGTLRALAQHHQVALFDNAGLPGEEQEGADPRVAALQAEMAQLQTQLQQTNNTAVVSAAEQELAQQFPDLRAEDVKSYLRANGMDESQLLQGGKLLSFDRIQETKELEAAAKTAITEQKQGLPPISSGAMPTPPPEFVQGQLPEGRLPTFDESFAAAEAELGPAQFNP